jgi:hypothetical protein
VLVCAVTICGVTQICLTVSGLCGYECFLVLVSLLYVGIVRFVIRLKYIPVAAGRLLSQGLDSLLAATGMYFNLITNRTVPTYKNTKRDI